jgi:hypothetical protein
MWARSRFTVAFLLFPFSFSLALVAGCRNCDLVEAELRTRDSELREMHADLARAEAQNEALVRELAAIRHGTAAKITPELASQTYTLKQITLGRGTGGMDEDDCPGDEALQVVVEPLDGDGHTIKAPGSVHVEALEITPEGLKVPLSSWELPPDQVRHTWRNGFLSTGYFIVLPWKTWPSSEKLRVIVRFTLVDGRVFEADKDVTIRPTPVARQKIAPPPSPPADGGPSVEPIPVLPPPRVLDPQSSSTSQAWWLTPPGSPIATTAARSNAVEPAAIWRPKPGPSLAESVELLRPTALTRQPGEEQ